MDSFDDVGIHQIYLSDRRRNRAYEKAIRAAGKKGGVALDLGCGTGLLSFFAARSGFNKIYAVDRSKLIRFAKKTAEINAIRGIEFIHGDLFDLELPEKVDLVIHDQIGDFLWDEGIVEKSARARRSFLKKGGHFLPYRIDFCAAPLWWRESASNKKFWLRKRYGLDFSPFYESTGAGVFPKKADVGGRGAYIGKPGILKSVDLKREKGIPKKPIVREFKVTKSGFLTAFLCYFEIHLDKKVKLSTAPARGRTNWGQILLLLQDYRPVMKGDRVTLVLRVAKNPRNWTWSVKWPRYKNAKNS